MSIAGIAITLLIGTILFFGSLIGIALATYLAVAASRLLGRHKREPRPFDILERPHQALATGGAS